MAELETVHYWIKSEKLPLNFNGVCLAFLTDLHDNMYGENNYLLIKAIEEQKPDYILTAGDLIVGKRDFDGTAAYTLLSRLAEGFEVYYANGNHERKLSEYMETRETTYVEYMERLRRAGIHFLFNDSLYLNRGTDRIRLTGLDLDLSFYRKFKKKGMGPEELEGRLGRTNGRDFVVLLAHNPDYFPQYAVWGADLVLSGHVHGGILIFPGLGGFISPSYHLFPKYDSGLFREGESFMVLSRGLGNHTIKLRFRNRPELSVIHLEKL